MATGFPVKANYATGDVLTAANMNDLSGTVNYLQYMTPRNSVLNSSFNVWQRGTSITSHFPSATYAADRWMPYNGGSGNSITVSRQATGDTTNLPNIQYCARVQRNSGQTFTSAIYLSQSFETINSIPFTGKTVTFSFYARAGANYSSASSALSYTVSSSTTTDGNVITNWPSATGVISGTATLTTTWQRFTATATVPTTSNQLGLYFNYTPVGTAGANDYFEITGVQLELGSTANTYMPNQPTYQGELAACQRYYWRQSADASNQYATFGQGFMTSTTNFQVGLQYPVTMRTAPTAIDYSNIIVWNYGFTSYAVSSAAFVANRINNTSAIISLAVTSATAGQAGIVSSNNSTSGYFGLTAEL